MKPEIISTLVVVTLWGLIIYAIVSAVKKKHKRNRDPDLKYGFLNPVVVCPHCQTSGKARSKQGKYNSGLSGGKILGALFTLGISLFFTGLSKYDNVTFFHCDNCNTDWRSN